MNTFTLIFLIALTLTTGLRAWLATRQIRHVTQNRDQVPAAFVNQISLEQHQKAADYTVAKSRLSLLQIALEVVVVLGFTLAGGLDWLARFWAGHIDQALVANVALIGSVIVLSGLIELPMDMYRKFGLEQRFGFNTMTVPQFLRDMALQFVLGAMLGLPLLFAVLWIIATAGSYWWLYAWLVWVGFNLTILAIYPNFIAPLFNKFEPLPDGELKQRIGQLLQKCGFAAQGLFVMDGSKRSRHGNAYFTGFGKSKRIVLFDTLIKHLQSSEIEAVLAHELGHFHHRHVLKRMVWVFGMSLAFLWVLNLLMTSPWFFAGLNVSQMGAGAGFVLFFMVLPVFTLPLQPLSSVYSRKHEFEADAYAAQHAEADDLVSALIKLYRDNAATLTPDSLYSLFYDSHPNAQQRVARLSASVHN
ncbi:M48 family metallopeptidase [Sulfuriferula thiophila]|uniref:M48 family metallopeptidase n=1 Tax=Sulfuriferula thiophila TaxID=1781211 RepID=UPI000F6058A9|nr:M48 family metallopeptidase [Sulfuriferula thiophila]